MMLNDAEIEALKRNLIELQVAHHDLDTAISAMVENPTVDQLQLRRLKKRKLLLKDHIARLESRLIPDLNA